MSDTLAIRRHWLQRPTLGHVFVLIVSSLAVASAGAKAPETIDSDVCVYGGTSGGVVAAVQAARMGKRAVIADPGRHLGGMTAGGLSAVDIGDPRSVGGIAREYFTRLAATVGTALAWDRPFEGKGGGPATGGAYAIEPHKAEQLFNDMAREAGAGVHFGARLASVIKDGARITGIVTEDGTVFRARMFIDATYEGDLMARAGVSHTLMREGNAKYGELLNGIHYADKYRPRTNHLKPGPHGRVPGGQGVWDRDFPLDPYVAKGDPKSGLLPLIQDGDPGTPGDPAPGVQAYCYRLCLTTNPANMIPIAPPPDYDPKRYEIVSRFIEACLAIGDDMDLRWFSKHDPLPNDKWDFNTATFGGNLPGASHAWPEATYAERERIAKEHEDYHRGLLHFLATDPRVPEKVRADMRRFGLPRDEFTDNGGWPHQIYVRQGRRMVSGLVMTEHHTFGREIAPNSVGLGSYGTDVHEIRRIARDGVVAREGKIATGRDGAPPYPIGYGAIVPRPEECENLFVTFALSASHTAFASIRMEPVFMCLSQSAATAACQAMVDRVPVQQVDYARLRERLKKDGQVLEWSQPARLPPDVPPKTGSVPPASRIPALQDLPLLFADDSGVASSAGVVRTTHPAKTRTAPVIEADRPWEGERVYVYGSVYPHAAGFIGLPAIFRLTKRLPKNEASPGQSPYDGPIDVQLATSADGRAWMRPEPRLNVIPRGAPGTFDGGSILGVSSTAAHVGEATWVYYTAMTTTHGGPIPPKRMSIGRAEWRRHGFVSLDAAGLGRVETKPLWLGAPSLIINADASRGQLRVALLEADGRAIAGCDLEDCEPLRADATRWTARWRSNATPPTDRPLQIVIEMTNCRLFSISTATPT